MDPGATHLSNMANGTPFYSAPEVVQAGQVTRASDVYSFGVLMVRRECMFVCSWTFSMHFPKPLAAPSAGCFVGLQ